jgi:hypothetical protein
LALCFAKGFEENSDCVVVKTLAGFGRCSKGF